MRKYLLFFCCLFAPLIADEVFDDEPPSPGISPPPLVNLTFLPSSIVNGSVNAISGDYVDSSQDLIVSGPDPYILSHSHCSSDTEGGTLADGWNFSHYHLLQVYQPEGVNFCASNRHDHHMGRIEGHCVHGYPDCPIENPYTLIYLTDPSGHRLVFKGDGWAKKFKLIKKNTGYTNVCGGEISGRTNIKNIYMKWRCTSNKWRVHFPDGTRRIYKRRKTLDKDYMEKWDWRDYHLYKEFLPSGNIRKYTYNRRHKVSSIRTLNHSKSRVLNWIKFTYKPYSLDITTSDKQNFYYFFRRLSNGKKIVSEMKRPGLPVTTFEYCKKSDKHERRVNKRSSEDGFFLETKYYRRPGSNKVGNEIIYLDSRHRKLFEGRVREQRMPTGSYTYYYHKDKKSNDFATDVKDAYGNITHYKWDKNKRLKSIRRCDPHWGRYMEEKFSWDKGHLEKHKLSEKGVVRLQREFTYDGRGNIIKETLSGEHINETTIKRTYSKNGFNLLLSEEDPLGNFTYYNYYKKRNLLKSKFTCDQKKIKKREFFHYNKSACLIKKIVDDGSSEKEEYLKDVTERHSTIITPRKETPHFGEPRIIREYALDGKTGKEIHLSSIINHFSDKGFITRQELRDKANRLYSTTRFTHDDLGRITSTTDSIGRKTTFSYDKSGRVSTKKTSTLTTHYFYDLMGRLTAKEEKDTKNGNTLINRFQYDLLGRKIVHINPQGHATHFSYDVLNRITQITYPQGATKKYSYERLGTIITETDENGDKTITSCNAFGAVRSKKFPDKTELERTYDLNGNCIEETAPNGTQTKMEYDFLGRLISSELQSSKTTYKYNTFHLLSETSPTEEKKVFTYDFAGQRKTQALSVNHKLHRITQYAYDKIGRLKAEKNHNIVKSYHYDTASRLIKEVTAHPETSVKKLFNYDADDNLTEETSFIMGKEATTRTSYDAFNRPIQHTDAKGHSWHMHYDDHFVNDWRDQVLKKRTTHPTGVFEEELYDIRGFLISIKRFDPFGNVISDKQLDYNDRGNCTRTFEQCFGGSKETITNIFSYGPLSRLESMIEGFNNPEEKKTTFGYNNYGQKVRETDPEGNSIYYTYDKKGRLEQFHGYRFNYNYFYDPADRLVSVRNNDTKQETKRSYTPLGDLASETLESGLTIKYDYDRLGRVSALTLPDNSKIHYKHDLFLKSISRNGWNYEVLNRDRAGNILAAKLPKEAGKLDFSYDNLNRKTKISHPAYKQELVKFDEVGNLLEMKINDILKTYSYNHRYQLAKENDQEYSFNAVHNRLSHITDALHSILHDGNREFTYDRRGNRTNMDNVRYHYDGQDRLIEVKTPSECISYSYDPFNRRLEKKSDTCHERYLYIGQNEIGAVDSSGKITQLRILGEGLGAEIGAAVAMEFNSELYIPLHDHRGNVSTLLDPQGNVVESYRYDAFGVEENTSTLNPWHFSSKRVDPETNLVYFGRRYYDPSLGSWLTLDPLGLAAGPNLYAYVFNNPMMKFDPYGLFAFEDEYDPIEAMLLYGMAEASLRNAVNFYAFFGSLVSERAELFARSVNEALDAYHGPLIKEMAQVSSVLGKPVSEHELHQAAEAGVQIRDVTDCARLAVNVVKQGINKGASFLKAAEKEVQATAANPLSKEFIKEVEKRVAADKIGKPFTKSSIQEGQAVHKAYGMNKVESDPGRFIKDKRLPSGKRPDLVDMDNHIVYELKPHNPNAIRRGEKQIIIYKKELDEMHRDEGTVWTPRLDTY